MRTILALILVTLLFPVTLTFSQGTENFNNYAGTSGTYSDGSFTGQDGSTWNYTQCRSDRAIVVPSPCMGKNRTPAASVTSGTIHNGCGVISFDYKQGYSSAVNLNLLINGLVVKNVTSPGGSADTSIVHNSGSVTVNVSGDFVIKFEQADNATSGQVTVDNVVWTSHSGSALPEPTNYPTSFTAVPTAFTINLSWLDAVGAQIPTAYLVLASDEDNIDLPVDGVVEPNDPNLADGTGALNVMPGVQTCQFGSLQSNKPFFFKIFPYTNTGTSINYKTDGTPPAATATTPNVAIINYENFNSSTFGTWTQKSVIGDTTWAIDLTHGVAATPCAKVTGYYLGSSHLNEDWLISPSMNFNLYTNEELTFQTAKNYAGPDLQAFISNDYNGTGDPNSFTWTPLTATLSAGGWVWTPSGIIGISSINGTNVHIAFKFTSTDTESSTWEVDEILTTGVLIVGVPEKNEATFTVSPNPSHGQFSITFSNDAEREVKVLSVVGSEVFSTVSNSTKLDVNLQGVTLGVYMVRSMEKGTSNSVTRKIIIK
jgi:hypothetical protein